MSDAESQLAARCRSGDRAALEEVYHEYVDRVWRYGYHRTRSREGAGEVVQETFLRVIRSIDRFEGRSSLGTWIFAIARSVAIEIRRRSARDQVSEPLVLRLVSDGNDPGEVPDREQARESVRRAIRCLPGAQHDAIVLYELSGLTIKEAADVLGWSEPRVKTTLFRARRRMRDELKAAGGELLARWGT